MIEGHAVCINPFLQVHSATASVQELRPAALRSELAYRALRVLDSSPLAGSGSLSKNFFSWQRGDAATWEQRTFESVTELPFKQVQMRRCLGVRVFLHELYPR